MPDMSVVVAAWGREALLRQCLAHLDAERNTRDVARRA